MKWISTDDYLPNPLQTVAVLAITKYEDGSDTEYFEEYIGYMSMRERWLLHCPAENGRGHNVPYQNIKYWAKLPKHPHLVSKMDKKYNKKTMKNIKKFESFVNEELDDKTYRSAAAKLRKLGQYQSSKDLLDHASNMASKRWRESNEKYLVYEFDIMRTWEQSFDADAEDDLEFNAGSPDSIVTGYRYGGYDFPEPNYFNIFFNNDDNNVGTIMTLAIENGKFTTNSQINACWMSNRKSAMNLMKMLRMMESDGILSEFLSDSGFVSLDELDINYRNFFYTK